MLQPVTAYKNLITNEILAGITTGLLVIPEALLFAFLAGIDPMIGISSYLVIGLVSSVLGGKPGLISGPERVSSMLLATIIAEYGAIYLIPSSIIIGFLIFLVGYFKLGKFIRLISKSTLLGFINGVAISILITQLQFFKTDMFGSTAWFKGEAFYEGIFTIIAVGLVYYGGTKIKRFVPPSFLAIVAGTLLVKLFDFPLDDLNGYINRIGEEEISLALPFYYFDQHSSFDPFLVFSFLPKLFLIAFICTTNTLVSLAFIDEITPNRGIANKECVSLGIASMISGILGFLPGSCMLGQSLLNVRAGGTKRISSFIAITTVLFAITFAKSFILEIPLAVLFGVMFTVVVSTFSWTSIKHIKHVPPTDAIVVICVTCFTIISNVGLAIIFGTIVSALVFAWENAKRIRVRKKIDPSGVKFYEIYGPLFFASAELFLEKFDPSDDPEDIVIDFKECRIWDQSGIEAVYKACELFLDAGKSVNLAHLSMDSRRLIKKTKIESKIKFTNESDDPTYKVVTDFTN